MEYYKAVKKNCQNSFELFINIPLSDVKIKLKLDLSEKFGLDEIPTGF